MSVNNKVTTAEHSPKVEVMAPGKWLADLLASWPTDALSTAQHSKYKAMEVPGAERVCPYISGRGGERMWNRREIEKEI